MSEVKGFGAFDPVLEHWRLVLVSRPLHKGLCLELDSEAFLMGLVLGPTKLSQHYDGSNNSKESSFCCFRPRVTQPLIPRTFFFFKFNEAKLQIVQENSLKETLL